MRYAIISTSLAITQLHDEVKKCGGRNLKIASASKQIFSDLDDTGVARLKAIGCSVTKIAGVKATVMPPVVSPPIPIAAAPVYSPAELVWSIGLEDLRSLTDPPLYGSGMNIAIIGTGIRETHVRINGRVIYSKNYTTDPMRDGYDHDTGICDIIVTIAPLCNILNLKVLNDKGEGTEEDVAIAIDDCISMHDTNPGIAPSVINLSLGGPDDGNPNNPLRVACRAAADKDIWILASAGNGGPIPYSVTNPACEKLVIAVGSIKYEPFQISDWSSRGPTLEGLIKPDIVMFGEDIVMASSVSDTATIAKSGTSFATPFCSALSLLYHEGVYRVVVATQPFVGLPAGEAYYVSLEELHQNILPLICIKPQDIAPGKDYDYGNGLLYGPLVAQALRLVPLADISTMLGSMMPILSIAMLGMIIVPMTKGLK